MCKLLDELTFSIGGFGNNRTISPPDNTSIKPKTSNITPTRPNNTASRNMN